MLHTIGRSHLFLFASWVLVSCGGRDESKRKAEAWIGKTFLLDTPAISSSNWTKPSGAIVESIGNLGVSQILFGVEAGSGDDLVITLGGAQEGIQDVCTPTTQVAASGAIYPNSTIAATTLPLRVVSKDPTDPWQVMTTIYEVAFKDILPGLDSIASSKFDGIFDYAKFAAQLEPGSTRDSICQISGAGGDPCETCPLDGEPYCLSFEAVQIGAKETTISVKSISTSNIPGSCPSLP
jgi:hypothetical protein